MTTFPELYFILMHQKGFGKPYDLPAVGDLFARAEQSGYGGVILYDHSLEALGSPNLPPSYIPNLRQVIQLAKQHNLAVVPQIFSYGHSTGILFEDIHLAEPRLAIARFVATPAESGGLYLAFEDPTAPLLNGDFEAHTGNRFSGWALQDQPGIRTFADTHVARRPGGVSLRMQGIPGAPATSLNRASVKIESAPFNVTRLVPVHARCWMKSDGLPAHKSIEFQLNLVGGEICGATERDDSETPRGSRGWRAYDYVCTPPSASHADSAEPAQLALWLGMGVGENGTLWVDDCSVNGVPLYNVLRRPGAELTMRSAVVPTHVYAEGADFSPISGLTNSDTKGGAVPRWPSSTSSGVIGLPAGSAVGLGERVQVEYFTVHDGGPAACLASQPALDYVDETIAKHVEVFGPGGQYMMRYDELRQMHSCAACQAQAPTAGELLAWHVNRSTARLRAAAKPSRMMAFQDMFDPYANGNRSTYYEVEGGITGAWRGLPPDLVMANWNHRNVGVVNGSCTGGHGPCATLSLRFFASLGLKQLIVGYYGNGNGRQDAIDEISNAKGVNGVLGMVYGSWSHDKSRGDPRLGGGDYTQLEEYAEAAKAHWPSRLA